MCLGGGRMGRIRTIQFLAIPLLPKAGHPYSEIRSAFRFQRQSLAPSSTIALHSELTPISRDAAHS